jgi:glycosyltransferase involved in cell wall biosynthesis
MQASDFPKLLVATEFPPNIPGGGGAIVRQMLKNWPVEKLFWWSCQPDSSQPFGQRVGGHAVATIPPKLYPNRRGRELKSILLENFWKPWAVRHFRKTMAAFQPDVVWVIPHCSSISPLADALLQGVIPYHFSIHDYPDIRAVIDRFGIKRSRRMAEQVDQLYIHATTRDAISQQMTDDLQARTGAVGTVTRAGLETEDFDYLSGKPETRKDSIRIAYAGSIIAPDAFPVFVKALAQIRHQLPLPLTLDFFGDHSHRSRDWFAPEWMKEHGNLALPELSQALKECTWGFSPMELTDDNAQYNRFSLPTKFGSYLAAGVPIISLGHPESTVVKMASQFHVGLCATSTDVQELSAQLLAALSEPDPKSKYRAEIQRCALAEFDARRMRAVLHENFLKCASGKGGKAAH